MNIIVTGSTGFMGKRLLSSLSKSGHNAIGLVRNEKNRIALEKFEKDIEILNINLAQDRERIYSMKVDGIIHTACCYGKHGESDSEIFDANFLFGEKVFQLAKKSKAKFFINIDTLLNKDASVYAYSKKIFAEWIKNDKSSIQVINLKSELFYGLGASENNFVTWIITNLINQKKRIPLSSGNQIRNILSIDDFLKIFDLIFLKMHEFPKYSEFDLASEEEITVKQLAELCSHIYKKNSDGLSSDLGFGDIKEKQSKLKNIKFDLQPTYEIGWKPSIKIEEGLEDLIKSMLIDQRLNGN